MMRTRLGVLVLAILMASPLLASGEKAKIDCKLAFSLKGWAALYETAHGTGTIMCSNGEKMDVVLNSKGFGLAAGEAKVVAGRGVFSPVEKPEDLLGTYIGKSAVAAAGESDAAAAFVKDDVSLAIYGQGKGFGLSSGDSRLTIERSQPPGSKGKE